MSQSESSLEKGLLVNAFQWFQPDFRQKLVNPIESQFPGFPFANEIQAVLRQTSEILQTINAWEGSPIPLTEVGERLSKQTPDRPGLFKQIVLRYRRDRAAYTERLIEKTFHLELASTVEQEIKTLDALVNQPWFQAIETFRLPRVKDYLPVQFIEPSAFGQTELAPRQYDEKFHILQAPALFLPDLAFFRAKCEVRDAPLALGFLDIDKFKQFNTDHTETKVDRNLLPRFMQTVEAHVYHHGYAYRQGGDEYLVLVPSMSREMSIAFMDELRFRLAQLCYPEIHGKTTVSIGLCVVEGDCPLTDRELRDRANRAKQFAKDQGRDRIATYAGQRFTDEELQVVRQQNP
jgi:diguanylate cyclase (GGDEF)-like protein